MEIRRADQRDMPAVEALYDQIHTVEESGLTATGWRRGIYPTRATAQEALARGDLFAGERDGRIVGAAILNGVQGSVYPLGRWEYAALEDEVMVLHTLVIAPDAAGQGYGRAFVQYYEKYAQAQGRPVLRLDTNQRNVRARSLYLHLGFREAGVIPCRFQGIPDVHLVLLEKRLPNACYRPPAPL